MVVKVVRQAISERSSEVAFGIDGATRMGSFVYAKVE